MSNILLMHTQIHSKLMQTCTIFAHYTNWLTRELEKSDPDLSSANKPSNMTDDQWRRFQATKATTATTTTSSSSTSSSSARNSSASASAAADAEARISNLFEIIRKWENNFSRHLQILLDALNHYAATETVVLLSLCARLSTANQGTEYAGLRTDEDSVA
jgi:gamma-tubulin complex component 2